MSPVVDLQLTKSEAAMAERIAARKGITVEQAAADLVKAGIARRVRSRTGKGPARIYSMRGQK